MKPFPILVRSYIIYDYGKSSATRLWDLTAIKSIVCDEYSGICREGILATASTNVVQARARGIL